MTASVVLVHGGMADGSTWTHVCEELDRLGVPNRAPDLPSCTALDPSIDFRDDAKHIRDVVDEIGGPVVLVGNSYGGFVITEAASGHPSARRLVFIAALMPRTGESPMDVLGGLTSEEFESGLSVNDDGLMQIDVEVDLRLCCQLAPAEEIERLRSLGGRPMSLGTDPKAAITAAAWETIPSTYVVCTEDLALPPDTQRAWASERASEVIEWASDHCPQHSRPKDVADLLARIAVEASYSGAVTWSG